MLNLLARFILWLGGWKITGQIPTIRKYVLVGGPHTSNWDFLYGISARIILQLPIKYIGKDALFRPPFGWLFRSLGGYPANRSTSSNLVDYIAGLFSEEDDFILALSPEGTRSKVDTLRTGFYHIARKAGVPIVMVGIDYAKREFRFSEDVFSPGEDIEADIQRIIRFFATCQGKNPELDFSAD